MGEYLNLFIGFFYLFFGLLLLLTIIYNLYYLKQWLNKKVGNIKAASILIIGGSLYLALYVAGLIYFVS